MRLISPLTLLLTLFIAPSLPAAERPDFFGETLLPQQHFGISRSWYDRQLTAQDLWQRALIELELFSPGAPQEGWRAENCHYDSALSVLQQIRRELGADTPYQKLWAANQVRVLDACADQATVEPLEPETKGQPARAHSDYLYQLASWHFYQQQYVEALKLYQRVGAQKEAPLRGYARYMSLRSLAALGRADEAYAQANEMLEEDDLGSRKLVANYRFILMHFTSRYRPDVDVDLADRHLRWLLGVIQNSPEKAVDMNRSRQDLQDATEQLAGYFVARPQGLPVDWWLNAEVPPNPLLQAVQRQARDSEIVDWLQAREAYNVLAHDWLWALHQQQAAYWQQNRAIVEHAWARWQSSGHAEWLQIAVARVHPQDSLAQAILQASEARLSSNWDGETAEYRHWLADLWTHSIRLHLGRDDLAGAMHLAERYKDYDQLLIEAPYTMRATPGVYSSALRWLVYQGKADDARQWLGLLLTRYPGSYKHWRTLLAQDWQEAQISGLRRKGYSSGDTDNSTQLWQAMLQLLPLRALEQLADREDLQEPYRVPLARTVLTRAILLDKDTDTLDRAAARLAKHEPELRELVLRYSEQRDHDAYVDLLLQVPRLRTLPYVEYQKELNSGWHPYELPSSAIAIDTVNHNDNNWWCRLRQDQQRQRLFDAAKIVPSSQRDIFDSQDLEQQPEVVTYLDKQRQLLNQHPLFQQIDQEELDQLAEIPSAPQYLSEAVIRRERFSEWLPKRSEVERNQRAANLHRAIRTTRYGCQHDGSHARYSQAAFKLLQQHYGDTIWARSTPYWFGCSHFRQGCPIPPEQD